MSFRAQSLVRAGPVPGRVLQWPMGLARDDNERFTEFRLNLRLCQLHSCSFVLHTNSRAYNSLHPSWVADSTAFGAGGLFGPPAVYLAHPHQAESAFWLIKQYVDFYDDYYGRRTIRASSSQQRSQSSSGLLLIVEYSYNS